MSLKNLKHNPRLLLLPLGRLNKNTEFVPQTDYTLLPLQRLNFECCLGKQWLGFTSQSYKA